MLLATSKLAGRTTYQDLTEFCFGQRGLVAISIFQFIFAFGGKNVIMYGFIFDFSNVRLYRYRRGHHPRCLKRNDRHEKPHTVPTLHNEPKIYYIANNFGCISSIIFVSGYQQTRQDQRLCNVYNYIHLVRGYD
jgi:hypothetical protein